MDLWNVRNEIMKLKEVLNESIEFLLFEERRKNIPKEYEREKVDYTMSPGRGYWVQNKKTGDVYKVYKPNKELHQPFSISNFRKEGWRNGENPNFKWNLTTKGWRDKSGKFQDFSDPASDYWEGSENPNTDIEYTKMLHDRHNSLRNSIRDRNNKYHYNIDPYNPNWDFYTKSELEYGGEPYEDWAGGPPDDEESFETGRKMGERMNREDISKKIQNDLDKKKNKRWFNPN
jgi:hypothetical protein